MAFSLLRTNVKLTSNIQIATDGNMLKLETFESSPLNESRYNLTFNYNNLLEDLIPKFFKNTPIDQIFSLNYDEDNSVMFKEFQFQYDTNYIKGVKRRLDRDDDYKFEYLAPIFIDNNGRIPDNFFIFRIDGPGNLDLTKDNFSHIIENFKVVESFDLKKSDLGKWLKNYTDNENFKEMNGGIDIDVRKDEFTKWKGIDVKNGGYTEKSLFTNDIFDKEQDFYQTDKILTSGYERNDIIYPKILNLKYLFNDIPADKEELKYWTHNRYSGFYANKILEKTLSFFTPLELKEDLEIDNNNFFIKNGNFVNPFVKWKKNKNFIFYQDQFYWVENIENDKWKIIADINLQGEINNINKNIITVSDNIIQYNSIFNSDQFEIDNFEDSDVWVIKIEDKFWRLKKDNNNNYYIFSDWTFNLNNFNLQRFVNQTDPNWTIDYNLKLVDKDNPPHTVEIFKLEFTPIKDFDTNIVNTKFAEYEYRNNNEISDTEEPKLYSIDLLSKNNPKDIERYIWDDNVENIPASSEYIATKEAFKIINISGDNEDDETLTSLWRKSPNFVKWSFKNSISSYDYPYRFNCSFWGEEFNRTVNPFISNPERSERNLDYFYTLNSSEIYDFQSLNIMKYDDNNIDQNFEFELERYFNIYNDEDYFKYLFKSKDDLKNENYNKSSKFNMGDNVETNFTLFRGIKFKIFEVDKVVFTPEGDLDKYSIVPTNEFQDYNFSIILTENNYDIESKTMSVNNLESEIILNWATGVEYNEGTIVNFNDILYISNTFSYTEDPKDNPGLLSEFDVLDNSEIFNFWSPDNNYNNNDWVFNNDQYYFYDSSGDNNVDFWDPGFTGGSFSSIGYDENAKIIYKGKMYSSNQNDNTSNPKSKKWTEIDYEDALWYKIPFWRNSVPYSNNDYVVFKDKLWRATSNVTGVDIPDQSSNWELVYNFFAESDVVYNENDLIFMNNTLYLIKSNSNDDTLDSGINIYINKKWGNILINIYINDNTVPNIRNSNRDNLYQIWNEKLTAKNFIDILNDVTQKYGFINSIKYYIIDENGFSKQNITDLDYLIIAEDPEEYSVIIDSKKRENIHISNNIFKSKNILVENQILDIDQLNWYDDKTTGVKIKDSIIKEDKNITFDRNIRKYKFWRFNGPYDPLFTDIDIFKWDNPGKFDLTLEKFGIKDEKIFSKVNLRNNILKLRNNDTYQSIWPILDEFGYNFTQHNIFKSCWDRRYYINVN